MKKSATNRTMARLGGGLFIFLYLAIQIAPTNARDLAKSDMVGCPVEKSTYWVPGHPEFELRLTYAKGAAASQVEEVGEIRNIRTGSRYPLELNYSLGISRGHISFIFSGESIEKIKKSAEKSGEKWRPGDAIVSSRIAHVSGQEGFEDGLPLKGERSPRAIIIPEFSTITYRAWSLLEAKLIEPIPGDWWVFKSCRGRPLPSMPKIARSENGLAADGIEPLWIRLMRTGSRSEAVELASVSLKPIDNVRVFAVENDEYVVAYGPISLGDLPKRITQLRALMNQYPGSGILLNSELGQLEFGKDLPKAARKGR